MSSVNDNPPIFDRSIYQRSISEDQTLDRVILQIHASDRDEADNEQISYTIDDSSSTFRINENTGEIFLIKSLDYEKTRSYSISVTGEMPLHFRSIDHTSVLSSLARDHGLPQLNNYAQLMIDVTDVNDNIPNILITEINGTKHTDQILLLSECTPTGKTINRVLFSSLFNEIQTKANLTHCLSFLSVCLFRYFFVLRLCN